MRFNDLKLRARALFKPGKVERELDDELAMPSQSQTKRVPGSRELSRCKPCSHDRRGARVTEVRSPSRHHI
jgi:hypothetical protein